DAAGLRDLKSLWIPTEKWNHIKDSLDAHRAEQLGQKTRKSLKKRIQKREGALPKAKSICEWLYSHGSSVSLCGFLDRPADEFDADGSVRISACKTGLGGASSPSGFSPSSSLGGESPQLSL
ncbi:unnamed protein product, partial [Amoebophrya sp. A25]